MRAVHRDQRGALIRLTSGASIRKQSTVRWPEAAAVALGAVVIGTIVGLSRGTTGVGATNSLYAEDGTIFFTEQTRKGTWSALTTPYNGYYHAVPRLVAAAADWVPVRLAAAGYAVMSTVVVVVLAVFIFYATAELIRSRSLRLCLALIFAVMPTA